MARATPPKKTLPSTQQFVVIDQIREGTVILKNGELRAIIIATSINFDLISEEEQNIIIGQYQSFLNSLDFPIQCLIHSRKLDISDYLKMLKMREEEQTNELLRLQISEYYDFIKGLTESTNIMSKRFYVVIPFTTTGLVQEQLKGKIIGLVKTPQKKISMISDEKFQNYKRQLFQRVDYIINGLGRMGIRALPLNTEELIELFFNLYNPQEIEKKGLEILREINVK